MKPTSLLNRANLTPFYTYKELIPLCGKNLVPNATERPRSKNKCLDEMQHLFACLKKWEYDDLHCKEFNEALQRCVTENHVHIQAQLKRNREGELKFHIASEGSNVKEHADKMSLKEINTLFKKYPQPDLPKPPYNPHQRMGHQPYWGDQFNLKYKRGKKS
ncbi:unnamed protein product [Meloidogyne enterolobii]|uniref:Uncharacterized protein n=3 Tax=Meloidogyne enterolobii TaxID=390850 RepID=A0ACB0ZA98_MELEN|nr:unnamed protein product [Meloidogyne enterolobii]